MINLKIFDTFARKGAALMHIGPGVKC